MQQNFSPGHARFLSLDSYYSAKKFSTIGGAHDKDRAGQINFGIAATGQHYV